MKNINIGIIGFGTVGTGVVRLLQGNGNILSERSGIRFVIKKIADIDIKRDRGIKVDPKILTPDAAEVIGDKDIDIVVELVGDINPAKEFITQSLKSGKHVITANKALLSEFGDELFSTARKNNRGLFFEASVGGGIPIIKSLREGLIGNRFRSLYGIVNGTSNYILTHMASDEIEFNKALKMAKEKGYAEADPALDISGADSAHKLGIIASLAFDAWIPCKEIYVEGISDISKLDIRYAGELGYTVKLVAITKKTEQGIELRVHPTLLPEDTMLASVSDTYNAIFYNSDFTGKGLLYGRGAGEKPTASAVVSDLVDVARIIKYNGEILQPGFENSNRVKLLPFDEVECRNYLKVTAIDKPGVLAKVAGILGMNNISIASVIQKERHEGEGVPVVMMTHTALEKDFQKAQKEIDNLEVVKGNTVRIRVEDEL